MMSRAQKLLIGITVFVINTEVCFSHSYLSYEFQSVSEGIILKDYYRLLETILKESPEVQISKLQYFLKNHPEYEPVYQKLFERYLKYNRISDAKYYFQNLLKIQEHRRNSYWMLAKISTFQNELENAFIQYEKALSAGPLSAAIIRDFLMLNYPTPKSKNDKIELLARFDYKFIYYDLILAISNFHNENYEQAIESFEKLHTILSHLKTILHLS